MADEVLFMEHGRLLEVMLNRPKALNALNTRMLLPILQRMAACNAASHGAEDALHIVLLTGAGGKALCAGGDVKHITQAALEGDFQPGLDFFRANYTLNYLISTLATGPEPVPRAFAGRSSDHSQQQTSNNAQQHNTAPHYWESAARTQPTRRVVQVAIMDGVTMGGGAGLCMNGPFRIATERTVFAMPEVGIGFFPDVGSSHFLHRLQPGLGLLLGLTGMSLSGSAIKLAGAATHFVRSADVPRLRADLLAACASDAHGPSHDAQGAAHAVHAQQAKPQGAQLEHHTQRLPDLKAVDAFLRGYEAAIDADECAQYERLAAVARRHFARAQTVAAIMQGLQSAEVEPALCRSVLDSMHRASPLSLEITWMQLARGRKMPFADAMRMEYRIAAHLSGRLSDMHEGVRCRLIERGTDPKWRYPRLEDVPQSEVEAVFEPMVGVSDLELPSPRL